MEQNTERVGLGGYVSVQQAGRGDGQLHTRDTMLGCDAARLALYGRAQRVGHDPSSQRITLEDRKHRNKYKVRPYRRPHKLDCG